jgi:N-acetylmuramoyl-L-alanine amidase-like protein
MRGSARPRCTLCIHETWADAMSRRATLSILLIVAAALAGLGVVAALSRRNTITPIGIVFHHTSWLPSVKGQTLPTIPRTPSDERTWQEYHGERGFGAFYWGRIYHLGYHYMILPDGTLKRGRPEHCIGAHTKGFNNYLGIVLVGDFSSRDNPDGSKGLPQPTSQQLRTLVSLCRQLQARYHFPVSRIVRHSDLERTLCPGDRFPFQEVLTQLQ